MLVYCIKVALMYNKRIYRNIEITEHQTLADLHEIIFVAFDRFDEHLYSFFLTRRPTRSRRAIYDSPEYTHPISAQEGDCFGFNGSANAEETKIGELSLREKEKIYYLFDFGDEWWHELTVLSIQEVENPQGYPRIVREVGESPEQYPD